MSLKTQIKCLFSIVREIEIGSSATAMHAQITKEWHIGGCLALFQKKVLKLINWQRHHQLTCTKHVPLLVRFYYSKIRCDISNTLKRFFSFHIIVTIIETRAKKVSLLCGEGLNFPNWEENFDQKIKVFHHKLHRDPILSLIWGSIMHLLYLFNTKRIVCFINLLILY